MELAYYTSEQLINELASRNTLAAIIIYSPKEVRETDIHHAWMLDFTPNLPGEVIHGVISEVASQLGEKLNLP